MSENVKSKIFEIIFPENQYIDTKVTDLGDVVLKIWEQLALEMTHMMSTKVKSEIFKIAVSNPLHWHNNDQYIYWKLVLTTAIFKNGGYKYRRK